MTFKLIFIYILYLYNQCSEQIIKVPLLVLPILVVHKQHCMSVVNKMHVQNAFILKCNSVVNKTLVKKTPLF